MADPRIRAAFAATDRRRFLPRRQRRYADQDGPLPIGHGQTNSQPTTVANMLGLLDVHEGHRILDVGSGSGWTTALLAHLVGPAGEVIGVERIAALAEWGADNLATFDLPWATIQLADPDVIGAPNQAPFDRILVSAGADALPVDLVDQLGPEGVLVAPVALRMLRISRLDDGSTETTDHGAYSFVPLHVPIEPGPEGSP